jgi:uncharacterized membrane protein
MPGLLRFLRATLLGGLLFLVPLVVLGAIVEKALRIAHEVSDPLATRLLPDARPSVLLASAAVLLALFCFLAGLLAMTRPARKVVDWLESTLLAKIPGYMLLKGAGESALGVASQSQYPVVLARIEDAWQFGFLVERLPDQHCAVFVPGAPDPKSGSVYFMSAERVRPSEISMHQAMKCLHGLGAGSAALLRELGSVK